MALFGKKPSSKSSGSDPSDDFWNASFNLQRNPTDSNIQIFVDAFRAVGKYEQQEGYVRGMGGLASVGIIRSAIRDQPDFDEIPFSPQILEGVMVPLLEERAETTEQVYAALEAASSACVFAGNYNDARKEYEKLLKMDTSVTVKGLKPYTSTVNYLDPKSALGQTNIATLECCVDSDIKEGSISYNMGSILHANNLLVDSMIKLGVAMQPPTNAPVRHLFEKIEPVYDGILEKIRDSTGVNPEFVKSVFAAFDTLAGLHPDVASFSGANIQLTVVQQQNVDNRSFDIRDSVISNSQLGGK